LEEEKMGDYDNKVTVKIYGQEYTISGDKPRDYIMRVADHVDGMMNQVSDAIGGGTISSIAVLAAINITGDYFSLRSGQSELDQEKEQLQKDIAHYMQLWEEAKKNFLQYKEDAQGSLDQRDRLQEKLNEKAIENDSLLRSLEDKDKRILDLEGKINTLATRLKAREEGKVSASEQMRTMEDKVKEAEGNFFELQMENIRLKSELERVKKTKE
jgi:cell division protein ZapA (FtsZ GTPase activity inhibitor)